MRRMWVALVAVALGACDTAPAAKPKGPTSEVERQVVAILAPNAQIVDQPFEDALALVDLPKAYGSRGSVIVDQFRKTRAAVEKRASSSLIGRAPHFASVAPVIGGLSIAGLAHHLAVQLGDRTKHRGHQAVPA